MDVVDLGKPVVDLLVTVFQIAVRLGSARVQTKREGAVSLRADSSDTANLCGVKYVFLLSNEKKHQALKGKLASNWRSLRRDAARTVCC